MNAFFTSQMDYIFFVYGFSFLLLAVTLYFLCRSQSAYPFLKWIALFAFMHGATEWMDMIALNFWNNAPFRVVRLVFLTLSFLCLVELAREEVQKKFGRICGPWIYIPLLLAVIVPGWMMDQWIGINVMVRYVLAVMGGLLAALVIYRHGRQSVDNRNFLTSFAFFLGLYVLTQFFVPESKVFPASEINQSVFMNHVGVPIQAFRMLCAALLAFLAWKHYLHQRKHHVVEMGQPYLLRVGTFFPALILIMIVLGWGAAGVVGEKRMNEKKKVLFALARYSAGALDPVKVASLTGTPDDVQTEYYRYFLKDSTGIYQRNPDAVSVYIFGHKNDQTIFLFDSMNPVDSDASVPAAQPGEVYAEDAKILSDMFRDGGDVIMGPEEDKWGNFMSGLSAIRSADTGRVVAILGIDYHVEEWVRDVAFYRFTVILITFLFIGLVIIFSLVYIREREVYHDLKDREQRLLDLSGLLEEERVSLETIFNSTQVGLMLVDPQLQIRRVNSVLSDLVGKDAKSMQGYRPGQGLACVHLDATLMTCGSSDACIVCPLARMVKRIMSTGEMVRDFELRHEFYTASKEKKSLWFEVNATPLTMAGNRHVLLSLADITERKAANEQLQEYHLRLEDLVRSRTEALNVTNQKLTLEIAERQEANRELQEAKNRAEEASELKSQFLFNVSHEIRTPLNGIIGFAELISRCEDLERARMMARTVLSESDILLTLVNDVLDQAKIEAGKMTFESQVVDLKELLAGMINTMGMAANKKGLQVLLESSGDVPQFVLTDRLRLCQILWNLLNNAVKFTDKGSVTLRTELFDRRLDQAWVKFSIRDTGMGIPEDKKHLIFERFAQVDGASTRKHGGAGLGTSIAKGLVELMSGKIGFESKAGEGSAFWFILPMRICDEPRAVSLQSMASGVASGVKGPVLVVEDCADAYGCGRV